MDSDAILPSSPPRASMAATPDSPCFEPPCSAYSPKSSSPPPLFSSDDSRESVDVANYESPRIYKNKRKGAWWDTAESAQNTPEQKKTKMSRNYDSGVYMMSDATDSSESLLPVHKSPFPVALDATTHDSLETRVEPSSRLADAETYRASPAELAFNHEIRIGLERNLEVYELRELGLQDDDMHRIGDLDSIIKDLPDPGCELPAEGQYRSMVPELYVNLGSNTLRRLTPALFSVRYLTTLVLRSNNIEELPQQLGQLQNLQVLDVSLNRLRTLPFEIIDMFAPHGSLRRVTTIGNPLLEPMPFDRLHKLPTVAKMLQLSDLRLGPAEITSLYEQLATNEDAAATIWAIRLFEAWSDQTELDRTSLKTAARKLCESAKEQSQTYGELFQPCFVARTPVAYLDQSGVLLKNSPDPSNFTDKTYTTIIDTARGTSLMSKPDSVVDSKNAWFMPPNTSSVASLLTTSVQTALKKRHQDDLSILDIQHMLPDPIPPVAERIFHRAVENSAGGYGEFRTCHVCTRDYIVARAEWIEFWAFSFERFLPVQVKVCSWGCVPQGIAVQPEHEDLH
ncbi:hypothetical protein ACN47E_001057 [Coniothyrium glycines]